MTSATTDTIVIRVRFFARLREELGVDSEAFTLASGATVAELIRQLAARGGAWDQLQGGSPVMIAVNQTMARPERVLSEDDEVALFPPVTGG